MALHVLVVFQFFQAHTSGSECLVPEDVAEISGFCLFIKMAKVNPRLSYIFVLNKWTYSVK